jgi:vacuolar-type H+-ATPase subunit B/Vma2
MNGQSQNSNKREQGRRLRFDWSADEVTREMNEILKRIDQLQACNQELLRRVETAEGQNANQCRELQRLIDNYKVMDAENTALRKVFRSARILRKSCSTQTIQIVRNSPAHMAWLQLEADVTAAKSLVK